MYSIGVEDFHRLYRSCFINTSQRNDTLDEIEKEIPNLVLRDSSHDRNQRIAQTIMRMRAIFAENSSASEESPSLLQLVEASSSIPKGKEFWIMCSKAIPFETQPIVQNLFIKRIKQLQDDLKKLKIYHNEALRQFFLDWEFFTKPCPLSALNSRNALSFQGAYFKLHNDTHMSVGSTRQVSEPTIPTNIYSEEELERIEPQYINRLKSIRDHFIAVAVSGNLIQYRIFFDRLQNEFDLTRYDKIIEPVYPYVATLCALIYNELKKERLHSMKAVSRFAELQLQYNHLFNPSKEEEIDLTKMRAACKMVARRDFFPFFKPLERQQELQNERIETQLEEMLEDGKEKFEELQDETIETQQEKNLTLGRKRKFEESHDEATEREQEEKPAEEKRKFIKLQDGTNERQQEIKLRDKGKEKIKDLKDEKKDRKF